MSKAMELAEEYSDAVSAHRLESLYGTSKSYTLLKAKDRDEAHEALSAELRRLAAVEAERDALKEELDRIRAMEPVYAFRRKGQDAFCTCDEARYQELSSKQSLFEVRKFYTLEKP